MSSQDELIRECKGKKQKIKEELELMKASSLYCENYHQDIETINEISEGLESVQGVQRRLQQLKVPVVCIIP